MQDVMRRAGLNPTDVEVGATGSPLAPDNAPQVHDIINKIDDGTGALSFPDFCQVVSTSSPALPIFSSPLTSLAARVEQAQAQVMMQKSLEVDEETSFKEAFKVGSSVSLVF
jgi:hypothetical protein